MLLCRCALQNVLIMKLLFISNKAAALVDDNHQGEGTFYPTPEDFDQSKTFDYMLVEGVPTLPSTVPQSVTRRQAKQALAATGKLDLVQPAIDAIPNALQRTMMQIEWDDSQVFERNRPSLIALGTGLGLTSEELDNLFTLAATL